MIASAPIVMPPDDGSPEVARWYALEGTRWRKPGELAELHETERVETSCLFCDETFVGPLREARAWFAQHRATAHPEHG